MIFSVLPGMLILLGTSIIKKESYDKKMQVNRYGHIAMNNTQYYVFFSFFLFSEEKGKG